MRPSRLERLTIGCTPFRVRQWGRADAPLIFMVHGWLDCSASFQFLVDALAGDWHVVAPDLRGHGGSHHTHESYPFMQLVADLDALLEYYSPQRAATLLGHSLGANVASIYAGVRPERVSHFINLEGVAPVPGFKAGPPVAIMRDWLAKLRLGPRNRVYADHAELIARLRQANHRLPVERAHFLAREFSHMGENGQLEIAVDPYEYASLPMFDHLRIVESAWPSIEAPILLVTGSESFVMKAFADAPGVFEERLALLRNVSHVHLPQTGHNVHHEAPEKIAELIQGFLAPACSLGSA